jgi:hypothetical protein
MQKTYSQKVARVFEVIDYFLLLPAAFGALVGLVSFPYSPLFALLLYGVLSVGIVLLVGYFKHSRGRLDEKYSGALWLTTAVYNFVFLLPVLYWASILLQTGDFRNFNGELDGGTIFFFIFLSGAVFSYLSAVVFSIKAFTFERRKKYI